MEKVSLHVTDVTISKMVTSNSTDYGLMAVNVLSATVIEFSFSDNIIIMTQNCKELKEDVIQLI